MRGECLASSSPRSRRSEGHPACLSTTAKAQQQRHNSKGTTAKAQQQRHNSKGTTAKAQVSGGARSGRPHAEVTVRHKSQVR